MTRGTSYTHANRTRNKINLKLYCILNNFHHLRVNHKWITTSNQPKVAWSLCLQWLKQNWGEKIEINTDYFHFHHSPSQNSRLRFLRWPSNLISPVLIKIQQNTLYSYVIDNSINLVTVRYHLSQREGGALCDLWPTSHRLVGSKQTSILPSTVTCLSFCLYKIWIKVTHPTGHIIIISVRFDNNFHKTKQFMNRSTGNAKTIRFCTFISISNVCEVELLVFLVIKADLSLAITLLR